MYLTIPYKISYDTTKYRFRESISNMLEIFETTYSLEKLHEIENYDLLVREKDQSTKWHKKYYDKFESDFKKSYLGLVEELKNRYGYDKIVYQKIPSFRVHLANGNVAVGEWHKDKTYNHGINEVNFWLPFVNTNSYNTVWIESRENKADYSPYNVDYGEILVFNGANLQHGNQKNVSSETRVSIDFRLVDINKFQSNNNVSINTKTKFEIGGYFDLL